MMISTTIRGYFLLIFILNLCRKGLSHSDDDGWFVVDTTTSSPTESPVKSIEGRPLREKTSSPTPLPLSPTESPIETREKTSSPTPLPVSPTESPVETRGGRFTEKTTSPTLFSSPSHPDDDGWFDVPTPSQPTSSPINTQESPPSPTVPTKLQSLSPSSYPSLIPSFRPSEHECQVLSARKIYGVKTNDNRKVGYKYQLTYEKGSIKKILNDLEIAISNLIINSSSFFKECPRKDRKRHLATSEIVGLVSLPKDSVSDKASCTSNDTSLCVVVNGKISLYFQDENDSIVPSHRRLETYEKEVQRIISEAMKNGDLNDSNPNINGCEIISEVDGTDDDDDDDEGSEEDDDEKIGNGSSGGVDDNDDKDSGNDGADGRINNDKTNHDDVVDLIGTNGNMNKGESDERPRMSSLIITLILFASSATVILVFLAAMKYRYNKQKHEKEIYIDICNESSAVSFAAPDDSKKTSQGPKIVNNEPVHLHMNQGESSNHMETNFSNNPHCRYEINSQRSELPTILDTREPHHLYFNKSYEDDSDISIESSPTRSQNTNFEETSTANSSQSHMSLNHEDRVLDRTEDIRALGEITPQSNTQTLGSMISPVVSSQQRIRKFNFDHVDAMKYNGTETLQQRHKSDALFDVALDDSSADTNSSLFGTKYADRYQIGESPSDENLVV